MNKGRGQMPSPLLHARTEGAWRAGEFVHHAGSSLPVFHDDRQTFPRPFPAAGGHGAVPDAVAHPPQVALDTIPYGDKIEHFTAFAALALMARLGFPRVADWHLLEHLSFLGAMIEVVQATPIFSATATGTTGSPTALARWSCWWRCGCCCAGAGRAGRSPRRSPCIDPAPGNHPLAGTNGWPHMLYHQIAMTHFCRVA
jgi:hypothetical protein